MESIIVKNASVNNLKHITISFPLNAFTCVTGVSGCGKSSLVYDTIYAESQRSFLESMSGNMYGQKLMDKPKVESIYNLRPALNIAQNYYNSNPRSTVGTITDISYYIRTIFALASNFEKETEYRESFFSPNNPSSCCKYCHGLGEEYVPSIDALVPDMSKTLAQGAIIYYKGKNSTVEYKTLEAVCDKYNIDINSRFSELSKEEINILLYRKNEDVYNLRFKTPKGRYKHKDIKSKGVIIEIQEKLIDIDTPATFISISKFLKKQNCSHCGGTKLQKKVLEIKVCKKNIAEVEKMSIDELLLWVLEVKKYYSMINISNQIIQLVEQIEKRVSKLVSLKVGYISLNRSIPSLSGGEIQRIRIATQMTCSLQGLLYILDEPCKGLHVRDIDAIINATKQLVNDSNTVIAIEHNKKYISCSDKIIELGPEGGPKGGKIISEYVPNGKYSYVMNFRSPKKFTKYIKISNITFHNILKQTVEFPVGGITCVTGVSGSGKSSLLKVIYDCFSLNRNCFCESVEGRKYIIHVDFVNQKPIGKTPRSTVISYLEIYDVIRNLFANLDDSKNMGLTSSDFSMNVKGGRCEECQGTGHKKIEMTYLPDSFVECPVCGGRRFNDSILKIKYKGYSINDILDSTINDVVDVFTDHEMIFSKLQCMIKIGLGYIKLGQMSMNLSGGEAQRIKLAKALGNENRTSNLYILDEPTSGLNEKDIDKFELILEELRKQGNTILIIEHNADFVIKNSDYVIDFGCNAGDLGGRIISQGYAKDVFENKKSSWNCLM